MTKLYEQYNINSYLFGGNAPYIEELYEAYLNNPGSVPENWRAYFDAVQHVPATDGSNRPDVAHAPVIASFAERAKQGPIRTVIASADSDMGRKRVAVTQLIAGYRDLGSRFANLDPLQRQERPNIPELDPSFYGFTDADLDIVFNINNTYFGPETASLRDLLQMLRDTYTRSIGAEFTYISDMAEVRWLEERLEPTRAVPSFSSDKKKHILERLTAAEGLERYLHTKYVGQKRFSLEGGESFIASLDETIQRAGEKGVQEIVIGMAHRGRLNVLVNILGKTPQELFSEFEGRHADDLPAGDVKYHQGFSSDVSTPGGPVHLSLAFNPSHLEIVNPVVEGSVKARMDRRGDKDGSQVLPILVHGDAAFAGQGVVMETLNLAQTRGYGTGGTVHIVINNQIGFTTSDPRDSRSTLYCSDVVKMIEAPVLHVNGDDPEAVVFATQIAVDYRMKFKKDIVVDIICFRKLGHNEQDTPALTQPLMYKKIAQHPGTRKLYADKLSAQKTIATDGGEELVKAYRAAMDAGKHAIDPVLTNFKSKYAVDWLPFLNRKWTDAAETAVPMAELKRLATKITTVPEGFKVHSLVEKVLNDRAAMGRGDINLDWGMGEHLAYASLVSSGYAVRLTGQDAGRGTFTHRHSVLHDQNRERWDAGTYIPLQNVAENQSTFTVIDSVLSEEAVLAFEYGYSTAEPNTLTIWEAQFGDFANGAQVVMDQFITSGETKWQRLCGLTMLLPHGYEGQGPEHSSARLERYLQLCAEQNMQVCIPSTPAQVYHMLRRQALRGMRRPLVVMSPKSLLRHPLATSSLEELANGTFLPAIGEIDELDPKAVKRVVMCSGKVYYDLLEQRRKNDQKDVAIIRIEQLYPFPHQAVQAVLEKYAHVHDFVWCQEEPLNQGAWYCSQHNFREV
ncbi:2-oxoglutarate dehydrogenase E1 component, partial [Herbaspirillum sp. NPDC087042]|uniref:2-oxoglutarate dehydrogenase E1 component n=1 Tax=Herbaspirillum sp. NPDC087042 TaxID=3364004 RepID=UPI00382B5E32